MIFKTSSGQIKIKIIHTFTDENKGPGKVSNFSSSTGQFIYQLTWNKPTFPGLEACILPHHILLLPPEDDKCD